MKRFSVLFLSGLPLMVGLSLAEAPEEELPMVTLKPAVRVESVSRFDGMSCEQLLHMRAESDAEQTELRSRNQQCLKRYQRFLPEQQGPNPERMR